MIQDVDEALKTLVRRDALNGSGAEVVFDAPTKDWAVRRNMPTVDLYLYDIREDMRRRRVGKTDVRDGNGRISGRLPPVRFFKLSYLITAWTNRPEDEHLLLSTLLACFLRLDRLPSDLLQGALQGFDDPVTLTIGHPPPEDRSFSDVWSALGGELKPSLDLVVLAPVDLDRLTATAPPVLEELKFRFARDGADAEEVQRQRRGRQLSEAAAGDEAAEETVTVGTDDQQGRIFEVRSFPKP